VVPNVDILIVGSGIAGLAVAEKVMDHKNVVILTKCSTSKNNSMLAQGGIAVALSKEDSWQSHFQDTLTAGCFINNKAAVELLVKNGPKYVTEWTKKGFTFDKDDQGNYLMGKEGAHQRRRILHAGGDQTGSHLISVMLKKIKTKVTIIEHQTVIDLIVKNGTCIGVQIINEKGERINFYANSIVLATGGMGGLYEATSNDDTIIGDGLALAYRAGCKMKDLDFIQFHPTLLFINGESKGLISEAVRGEGAVLVTATGKKIMEDVHHQKDLSPRDIVARAIFFHLQKGEKVYLDISAIDDFYKKFPSITKLCQINNLDLKSGKIPVAPGAHFHMGGIATNLKSETHIKNLYAVGEVSCLGVHGANRLASNSLLEGIVYGGMLGEQLARKKFISLNIKEPAPKLEQSKTELTLPTKKEIQNVMMEKVGIIRTEQLLNEAKDWFESYGVNQQHISTTTLSNEQLTLWNMLTVGWLITKAALNRIESIGAHYLIGKIENEGMRANESVKS